MREALEERKEFTMFAPMSHHQRVIVSTRECCKLLQSKRHYMKKKKCDGHLETILSSGQKLDKVDNYHQGVACVWLG